MNFEWDIALEKVSWLNYQTKVININFVIHKTTKLKLINWIYFQSNTNTRPSTMDNSSWVKTARSIIITLKVCSFNLLNFDGLGKSWISICISALLNLVMIVLATIILIRASHEFGEYVGDLTFVTFLVNLIETILTCFNHSTFIYLGIFRQFYQKEIVLILKSLEARLKKLNCGGYKNLENFNLSTRRKCFYYLILVCTYYFIFCIYFLIFYVVKVANIYHFFSATYFYVYIIYHECLMAVMCSVVLVLDNYFRIINTEISVLITTDVMMRDSDSDTKDFNRHLTNALKLRHEVTQVFLNLMRKFGIFVVASFIYCSINLTVQLYMVFMLIFNNKFSFEHSLYATVTFLWMFPALAALQFFGVKCTEIGESHQETRNILTKSLTKLHFKKNSQVLLRLMDNEELELSANGFMIIDKSVIFRVSEQILIRWVFIQYNFEFYFCSQQWLHFRFFSFSSNSVWWRKTKKEKHSKIPKISLKAFFSWHFMGELRIEFTYYSN